jgi:orotate phosphoribosyltransferase
MQLFDPQTAARIANNLLDAEAVKLRPSEPFVWASGWKSPIYCDNRLTLSFPQIRTNIKYSLAELVKLSFRGVEAIAGVATAGIAQGALTADLLNLPFMYVRSKAKGHGMENLIEGKVESGQKVVVLEDLVSTGGSSLNSVNAIRNEGKSIVHEVFAIFSYGMEKAETAFREASTALTSLTNIDVLVQVAQEKNYISEEDAKEVKRFIQDPPNWAK